MSESNKSSGGFENRLIEIMVLVALLAVGIAVARAYFMPHRRGYSAGNGCINNLRQIDAAACQFALEKGLTNGSPISFPNDLTPYIKLNSAGRIPPCPGGGIYHISKVGDTPICTLSTATPAHKLE